MKNSEIVILKPQKYKCRTENIGILQLTLLEVTPITSIKDKTRNHSVIEI